MDKRFEVSFLLDFYGDLLTDKQRQTVKLYHNNDLSLAEIAADEGISRQGVRDAVKRSEDLMFEMESKLHLAQKFLDENKKLEYIEQLADEIENHTGLNNIIRRTEKIKEIAKELRG